MRLLRLEGVGDMWSHLAQTCSLNITSPDFQPVYVDRIFRISRYHLRFPQRGRDGERARRTRPEEHVALPDGIDLLMPNYSSTLISSTFRRFLDVLIEDNCYAAFALNLRTLLNVQICGA